MKTSVLCAALLCAGTIVATAQADGSAMWESHVFLSIDSPRTGSSGAAYAVESFNTHLPLWKSAGIVSKVTEAVVLREPGAAIDPAELAAAVAGVEFRHVPNSRLVRISAFSPVPEISRAIAFEYGKAIENAAAEENKTQVAKATAVLREDAERARGTLDKLEEGIRASELEKKSQSEERKRNRRKLALDLENAEKELAAKEYECKKLTLTADLLRNAKGNPGNFEALPANLPLAAEVQRWFAEYKRTKLHMDRMTASGSYDKRHPLMVEAKITLDAAAANFAKAADSCLKKAESDLADAERECGELRRKVAYVRKKLDGLGTDGDTAEDGPMLAIIKRKRDVEYKAYSEILVRLAEARARVESGLETISVAVPDASKPQRVE